MAGVFFLQSKAHDQSGQGVLEYILVLVVTVGLVVGLLAQFNRSVEVWLNNYFGDYLACLLETGELPSLGSQGDLGICAAYHSPFTGTVADLGDSDSNDDSGSNGSSNDLNSPESQSKNKKSVNKSAASRGGVNSSSSSTSNGKFGRISKFRAANNSSRGGGTAAARGGEGLNTGSTKISTPNGLSDSSSSSNVVQMETKNLNYAFAIQREEELRREEKIRVLAKNEALKKSRRSERFPAAKPPSKRLDDTDANLDVGFGDYLRYLLIAAIIIAILIFFGGQVLQMSKSME